MHIYTTSDGKAACSHCARPFEEHPREKRRQELHAKLCAIEDDDHAARAFHYHRCLQARVDQMKEIWVSPHGLSIPDVGTMHAEGIKFTLEPGVLPERMIDEVDKNIIPAIRQNIIELLNGTYDAMVKESMAGPPPKPYDPTWCPDTPTVKELYPYGYARHADGNVEPLVHHRVHE